jgi:hypothetical protein
VAATAARLSAGARAAPARRYHARAPADGWLASALGIQLRPAPDARLELRLRGEPASAALVP